LADKKPTVLIVDDEQMVCDVLRRELTEDGYLCVTALTGDDALSKIATQGFEVALLDIKLPGISGIEVLKEIRSRCPGTVAIMITVIDEAKTVVEAMKLGASDYILKPFDLDRVNTSIRTVLENKQRSPERRDKQTGKVPCSVMDAIAYGVEAKLDFLTGYSKMVTQRTIDCARDLGIPEKEVREWATTRAMRDSEKQRVLKSLVEKVERSALPWILGMTEPLVCAPKPKEHWN